MSLVQVIDAHIPSLSKANEDEMVTIIGGMLAPGLDGDVADLAIRTCACGVRMDGFYAYIDHLKEVLHEAGLITDTGVRLT